MENKWTEPGVVAPGRLRQENHAGFEVNIHEMRPYFKNNKCTVIILKYCCLIKMKCVST